PARPATPPQEISVMQQPLPSVPVTPASAGWRFLSFDVIELAPGESHDHLLDDQETAVTPLSGRGTITLGDDANEVSRTSVFEELAPIGYAPPATPVRVSAADAPFTFAIGSAPAEGMYPARMIEPSIIRTEVRGGGTAHRQVNHSLAYPIEAERLILYEVYVPRGMWSGWAPHRHDGVDGAPYLEEVYYFRLDAPGFWIHRNWHDDDPDNPWEELYRGGDGDFALVPAGYHSSVACPGSNMYFLNYLAGELVGDERKTPPCFDQQHTWIESDWGQGAWSLPIPIKKEP
ncbi:MAG: 5-deoxy-glucuronate isomerase, partial [Actinomycetota bacterium]